MFLTGLFYMIFEESIARRSGRKISVLGARVLMGVQVRMSMPKATGLNADLCDRWAWFCWQLL